MKLFSSRSRRRREGGNNESSSSILSGATTSTTTKSNQYDHHHPYSTTASSMSTTLPNSNKNLGTQYPHHIQLPDGEYGDDRHMQIRTFSQVSIRVGLFVELVNNFCLFSFQQSEIPRTYTRPPPNKSVHDVPGQLNYKQTSTSASNLHEHFGSGRSIANASSTSAPVSKMEKSKHSSKFLSFTNLFGNKPSTNKLSDSSSSTTTTTTTNQMQTQQNRSTINSNNQYLNNLSTVLPSSSSSSPSPTTFTSNPQLDSQIGCLGSNNLISSSTSHLLNVTVPQHHSNFTSSDHLAVSPICSNIGGSSCSSRSSSSNNLSSIRNSNNNSSNNNNHKPISCPTHSSPSPIEEAASLEDVEDGRTSSGKSRSTDTRILSSSLESSKSSSLFM